MAELFTGITDAKSKARMQFGLLSKSMAGIHTIQTTHRVISVHSNSQNLDAQEKCLQKEK